MLTFDESTETVASCLRNGLVNGVEGADANRHHEKPVRARG